MNKQKYLYIAVFFSGMTSMALEFGASRLLENYFGSSNLVWACVIGLIMIYLTLGYFIGGRWADRSPHHHSLYNILAWAALCVAIIPAISKPILRFSANAFDNLQIGILAGSFIAVIILFVLPVTLMGTASPFAIRLAISEASEAGKISGKIYAISTLGSFLGSFLPVLILIPTIGTNNTFLFFSILLLIIALIGLGLSGGWKPVLRHLWMVLVVLGMVFITTFGPLKNSTGQVYESESSYNYIQVLKEGDYTLLRLNEGQGIHSIYNPNVTNYYGPWEQFMIGPFFNAAPYSIHQVKSMAIVGLAAGTAARQATKVFGDIPIDGYEIDPKIIEVGQKYFDMNEPNLNPITQDGRVGLDKSTHKYSIIAVDAYRPPYIPWYLTTKEFFQIARDHLDDDGVLTINVGRSPSDRNLIDGLSTTIGTIFPSIYVMDLPNSFNSMIFATVKPTTKDNLLKNYQTLTAQTDVDPLLLETMAITITNMQPDPAHTVVFTDDLAPIEMLTNKLVLSYVLSGQVEELQK
jgi:spermidine synthase